MLTWTWLRRVLLGSAGNITLAVQAMLAIAISANAVQIVAEQLSLIGRPTGIQRADVLVVESEEITLIRDRESMLNSDLAQLRRIPGVLEVTTSSFIPFSGIGFKWDFSRDPADKTQKVGASYFIADNHFVDVLGLHIIAGRNFSEDEIQTGGYSTVLKGSRAAIVTEAMAEALYPRGEALGKPLFYNPGTAATIVGIVERMHGSDVHSDSVERSVIYAGRSTYSVLRYLIKVSPGEARHVVPLVIETLRTVNPSRVTEEPRPLSYYFDKAYQKETAEIVILDIVTLLMAILTAVGVLSLASTTVASREREIGTRRALGANGGDIAAQFFTEMGALLTAGLVVGALLAYTVNAGLSYLYSVSRLSPLFLAAGAVLLYLSGAAGVALPVRRATAISPATATRGE